MKWMSMAVGFAAGYVLGTKAGRERYEQISDAVRHLPENPQVAQAQEKVKEMASRGREKVMAKTGAPQGESDMTDFRTSNVGTPDLGAPDIDRF